MKKICILIVLSITCSVFGAEITRKDVQIQKLHPLSKSRVQDAGLAGYTRVYVNSSNWGASSCRQDAADLNNEDSHLLSILLAAWASKKSVDILVDDSLPKAQSTVCRITGLVVHS